MYGWTIARCRCANAKLTCNSITSHITLAYISTVSHYIQTDQAELDLFVLHVIGLAVLPQIDWGMTTIQQKLNHLEFAKSVNTNVFSYMLR